MGFVKKKTDSQRKGLVLIIKQKRNLCVLCENVSLRLCWVLSNLLILLPEESVKGFVI